MTNNIKIKTRPAEGDSFWGFFGDDPKCIKFAVEKQLSQWVCGVAFGRYMPDEVEGGIAYKTPSQPCWEGCSAKYYSPVDYWTAVQWSVAVVNKIIGRFFTVETDDGEELTENFKVSVRDGEFELYREVESKFAREEGQCLPTPEWEYITSSHYMDHLLQWGLKECGLEDFFDLLWVNVNVEDLILNLPNVEI